MNFSARPLTGIARILAAASVTGLLAFQAAIADDNTDETVLLWGDTHLHTSRSFDAYVAGNVSVTPDVAYRFARGFPVLDPRSGTRVQLDQPLDFLVVADHVEMMDIMTMLADEDPRLTSTEVGRKLADLNNAGRGGEAYNLIAVGIATGDLDMLRSLTSKAIRKDSWSEVVEAAERNNDPGSFTAFSGWEWTAMKMSPYGSGNMHRVVFTDAAPETAAKFVPHSSYDSSRPEDLWNWIDTVNKEAGADFVAIPHNSNLSGGLMFDSVDSDGRPFTAEYARLRVKWEPVVEMTQIKGDSETHPLLSPQDEFADFETFKFMLDVRREEGFPTSATAGDYIRPALKTGLQIENDIGVNPFKFGLIGSTDAHTGFAAVTEREYLGKMSNDSLLVDKPKPLSVAAFATGWDFSASGLAAVWARENTREAIFEAFKRKEVYATTGSRILLKVFGGFHFETGDQSAERIHDVGYRKGVPMGGDLMSAPEGAKLKLVITSAKDPRGVGLDRIQVVKGWLDDMGVTHEKIYDVAWSGNRTPGVGGRVPSIAADVDTHSGRTADDSGAAELAAFWQDPDFEPDQRAFYYVRVLEVPRARHSTLDAIALDEDAAGRGYDLMIQDRAYSSPIWYTP